ncbi:MAG: radical SAM protein [Thermodesulfovibrionales bacterium]|nr:radical SAM protein [Thermodesulfovibrionales bacterium]
MKANFVTSSPLPGHSLWGNITGHKSKPLSFYIELTARCNNNCTHCYENVSADDVEAKKKELSLEQLKPIIDEAVSMGALWCTITGGEPLIRKDFSDIYLYLKKKGLLVSVFTNATLITDEHIRLFKKYPPRDLEVTVYGVTSGTYNAVTRNPGSFKSFMKGLGLILKNNVRVRLKAMALRSNYHELPRIADFCRARTKDYFRFDPFLNLRYDRDSKRNKEIQSERLQAEEIVLLEKNDPYRFKALKDHCHQLTNQRIQDISCGHLFRCGAGTKGFYLSHNGMFRLCSSLCNSACEYDLKEGTLREAWEHFVPRVRKLSTKREKYLQTCGTCPIINLCMWCPAHADLETGHLDQSVDYFCEIAHKREEMLKSIEK